MKIAIILGTRPEIIKMASIIRGIARDEIEWMDDEFFGVKVPKNVAGMDITKYDVHKFYTDEQIEKLVSELKKERKEYLNKFPNLNEDIKNAFEL